MKRVIKQRATFEQVLGNCDDQVIVRELLEELIPEEIKQNIVSNFNRHATEYNQRIAKLYGKEELREGCHV